jgi:nucleoside-diphosphate-sugar epimerase
MQYKGLTVLVTGGAGFIGSHLADALLDAGATVRIMDIAMDTATSQREGSVTDAQACVEACKGVDVIFHQAAVVSVPLSVNNPRHNHDVNITGTLNMLMAAAQTGVKRFVYASSAAVYGGQTTASLNTETQSREYSSPYALSKGVCEDYADLFARKEELGRGMTCVGLRYFNVYGPRQNPASPYAGVISIFVDKIQKRDPITVYGDGSATRDFVHVSDVVRANMMAGVSPLSQGHHVFNVGTGIPTSLSQLIGTIKTIVGNEASDDASVNFSKERVGDVKHSVADIRKIRAALGYEPKYSLEDGLRALIATTA